MRTITTLSIFFCIWVVPIAITAEKKDVYSGDWKLIKIKDGQKMRHIPAKDFYVKIDSNGRWAFDTGCSQIKGSVKFLSAGQIKTGYPSVIASHCSDKTKLIEKNIVSVIPRIQFYEKKKKRLLLYKAVELLMVLERR